MVAGSRYAADDFVRSRCESALLGVSRYTVRDLVYALAEERLIAADLARLTRIGREALAASVAAKVRLEYLREVARFPGFPRALARTLQDLRLARVQPAALREAGRSGPDLARLLEAWDRELRARRFADYPVAVAFAIEQARTMDVPRLVLLHVDLRSAAESELIRVLSERASSCENIEPITPEPKDCLTALQRYALSGEAAPAREADGSVVLSSAPSEALECVDIARRILWSGVPFDECAVLLRHPARYSPTLREAFDRAGIPAWFTAGAERPNVAGRAFLTLLRFRTENYSAVRFAEYLSLGQMPREEAQTLASGRWERLLREAAVIAGGERWESRLTAAIEKRLARYQNEPSESVAKDIGALESLRGFAVPVVHRLGALPEQGLWREWIEAMGDLAAITLKDPRSVNELLDELAPLADLGPVSLADVLQLLEKHLLTRHNPETGTRYGKVFVCGIEEARGMQFRRVFVPGVNEGTFPRPVREDPLLLDAQRMQIGMEMTRDDGPLLRIAAASATEAAVFSWSRLELATGRERVPSFFAVEVLKASRGSSADIPKLLEAAKSSSSTTIGWSAPDAAAESIDDAEYDLSTFRASIVSKENGGCGWLTKVNPHTARAIRMRQSRWGRDWTYADGLNDPGMAALLQKWRLKKHAYSPSSLAQFARCPYRFFLSAILRLRPFEQPEALGRMDPLVRGRLFHRTVFHLFRDGAQDALERVDAVLERLAAEAQAENAPVIPGVWAREVQKLRTDLRGWLTGRELSWEPLHAELAFDPELRDESDPASVREPVTLEGGYQLRGVIDLVERHSNGRLRVVDHKTGRVPEKPPESIGFGEVLQPILYSLAAEAMLGETPVEAVLSYATLRENYKEFRIPIHLEARVRMARVLGTVDAWIDKGFLPAAPRPDACKDCEYRPVCGPYEEMRLAGKSEPELHDLGKLRSQA